LAPDGACYRGDIDNINYAIAINVGAGKNKRAFSGLCDNEKIRGINIHRIIEIFG